MAAQAPRRLPLLLGLMALIVAIALGAIGVWVARRRASRRLDAFTEAVVPVYDRLDHPDVSMVSMGAARRLAGDDAAVTIQFIAFGWRGAPADERTTLCEVEIVGHHPGTDDDDAWELQRVRWSDADGRTADLIELLRRSPEATIDLKAVTDGAAVTGSALGGLSGAR